MDSQHRAVATTHLAERATVAAVGTIRGSVIAFAEEHGMAVDRRLELAPGPGGVGTVALMEFAMSRAASNALPAAVLD